MLALSVTRVLCLRRPDVSSQFLLSVKCSIMDYSRLIDFSEAYHAETANSNCPITTLSKTAAQLIAYTYNKRPSKHRPTLSSFLIYITVVLGVKTEMKTPRLLYVACAIMAYSLYFRAAAFKSSTGLIDFHSRVQPSDLKTILNKNEKDVIVVFCDHGDANADKATEVRILSPHLLLGSFSLLSQPTDYEKSK